MSIISPNLVVSYVPKLMLHISWFDSLREYGENISLCHFIA
jgi:hypothetical protein